MPALDENNVSANLPVRTRLARHRADPACASCHDFMDPVGFALENYDAVGRWRTMEEGQPVDASGGLPDGSRVRRSQWARRRMLKRPEVFTATLTEKLLTFALGRGIDYYDGPAVREIVRRAAGRRLSLQRHHPGYREQHSLQNETNIMSTFTTRTSLPRRTFLRGMGATLALPLLDAMVPAATKARADRRRSQCAGSASSSCRWAATSRAGRRRARASSMSCRSFSNRSRR